MYNKSHYKRLYSWIDAMYNLVESKDKVGVMCNELYKQHGIRIKEYSKETSSKWNKHLVIRKWVNGSDLVKRNILESLCAANLITTVNGLQLTKSQMAKVSKWISLFIKTNYTDEILEKRHFVIMISGPTGSGKTWSVRDILSSDERWSPVWIDTDEMNLKNNYEKIFCNSTFSNKNVYASLFANSKQFKMYVLDDMEVITNKNAVSYITKTMLNTHISRMTERVWMSQKNSVPLIIICTNANSTNMYKLMSRLKGLDTFISWPRPTHAELQKVAMTKYSVPMIHACVLAKRSFGDFRVLENMICYSSSESDALEDCDETIRRIHIGYPYKTNCSELSNSKLYDNIFHSWPIFVSNSGNSGDYSEIIQFVSDIDVVTSDKNNVSDLYIWEYKNLLALQFLLTKKNTKSWDEDEYFSTLSTGRSFSMKLLMHTKKDMHLENFIKKRGGSK